MNLFFSELSLGYIQVMQLRQDYYKRDDELLCCMLFGGEQIRFASLLNMFSSITCWKWYLPVLSIIPSLTNTYFVGDTM